MLASLLALTACNEGASVIDDSSSSASSTGWMEIDSSSSADSEAMDDSSSSAAAMEASSAESDDDASSESDETSDTRIIEMSVSEWAFSPSAITAKTGEKLIVRLTGVEGVHSFAVPELGINMRLEAGETVDVTIPTDKAGTFAFQCMVPCGAGHKEMKGSIVIS
jgi:cytochrome c oxidase subunit 2